MTLGKRAPKSPIKAGYPIGPIRGVVDGA